MTPPLGLNLPLTIHPFGDPSSRLLSRLLIFHSNRFDQWKSLATVRVVFAMVGWMGYVAHFSFALFFRLTLPRRSCIVVFIHQMMAVETKDDVVKSVAPFSLPSSFILLNFLLSLLLASDRLWDHITRLKKRINGDPPPLPLLSHHSVALQGDEFASDITAAELKQLIRMQKLGVERAEATLKTLDQS
jgi:hypothetical protein